MTNKLTIFLRKYPAFLYLLPVFFVLHGFRENYDFVPVSDAMLLVILYIVASLLFLLLFWLFYKNWLKSALASAVIMSIHFFFGSIQDGLRNAFPNLFLSRYIFIVPVILFVMVLLLILLRRRKSSLQRLSFYLSSLFLILILIDGILLLTEIRNKSGAKTDLPSIFTPCPECNKPDVYVIIADEYAGNTELKDLFHFDDSSFLSQLDQRGFHTIPHSASNYNYTPYSIASTLNMDYLNLERTGAKPLLAYTYETIGENKFLRFFQHHGYQFYNLSLSDFKGYPSHATATFLPVKTKLITSQTFLSRVEKELRFHLVTDLASQREIKKTVYDNRDNNQKLSALLEETARVKSVRPKFVLTHLMMPHYPYYYDRNGNQFPFDSIIEGNQVNRVHYVEYLQYSNTKLLSMIDVILNNAKSPPIIVLMGDHGFRHFTEAIDPKYYFINLVSVLIPGKNYQAFDDSLTNVNLLRTILNTSFNQHLPYLKDTSIIMDNP